ncbi:helix-turn-helix transcriptional regulator [Frankia sp. R43]|uniref:helix-turn-helix transcriptional regulator n=1 Tax=Frankia sp. R43 TaxID=269536 RepID=UPI00350F7C87
MDHRARHGLSQRDLARLVGIAQPAISRLEQAEHQPSLETLAKLSRAAGLIFHLEVTDGAVDVVET